MNIRFNQQSNTFKLDTKGTSYVIKVTDGGFLTHLYYGSRLENDQLDHVLFNIKRSLTTNPKEAAGRKSFSLDMFPLEYPAYGTGDFRPSALMVELPDGSTATDLRYIGHSIYRGKKMPEGLPAVYAATDEVMSLEILCRDPFSGLEVQLCYHIYEDSDAMTRSVRVKNTTGEPVYLRRVLSCAMDFTREDLDFVHFYGRHLSERNFERLPVHHTRQRAESLRGASSAQENPFVMLAAPETTEHQGECWGFNFVYSGNFLAEVGVDQTGTTRFIMGIHPTDFSWKLEPGEVFCAPEVVLAYSADGFNALSAQFHKLYRTHLCRGKWRDLPRPVLVNSWEAAYFNYDKNTLIELAKAAAPLGIEMLVMDDGWFGRRKDISSSLGDWTVNEDKLDCTLTELVDEINAQGIKFGIWYEPEMISEDSELFREHPDWCLQVPGRARTLARSQLVLDMSRQEVQDYLFNQMERVLSSANIEYVKWDMNRNITEAWSAKLPADRQREIWHRYILGVYALLERLQSRFPDILWEGCASGGGRFDPGMLYYFPQIWASDDTDALERTRIQCGTSYAYPPSSISAHVSAVPNHKSLRNVSMETRGIVAMGGILGYELDLRKISDADRDAIRQQIKFYKENEALIRTGNYTRLETPFGISNFSSWCFWDDRAQTLLVSCVQLHNVPNAPVKFIRLPMADEAAMYVDVQSGEEIHGSVLKHVGFLAVLGEIIKECQYAPDGAVIVKKFVVKK